jgi:hypothetical protein
VLAGQPEIGGRPGGADVKIFVEQVGVELRESIDPDEERRFKLNASLPAGLQFDKLKTHYTLTSAGWSVIDEPIIPGDAPAFRYRGCLLQVG